MQTLAIAAPASPPALLVHLPPTFELQAHFDAGNAPEHARPVEPPVTPAFDAHALAIAIGKWLPYIRPRFRPLIDVWVTAILAHAAIPISPATLRSTSGMMRKDVEASQELLRDARQTVMAAWLAFYPRWVEGLIAGRAKSDPLFLLPADEYARQKAATRTINDTSQKREKGVRELCVRLFERIESCELAERRPRTRWTFHAVECPGRRWLPPKSGNQQKGLTTSLAIEGRTPCGLIPANAPNLILQRVYCVGRYPIPNYQIRPVARS